MQPLEPPSVCGGDPGGGLSSAVSSWLHAVIVAAWNERGADFWGRFVPASLSAAVPAPFIAESPAMRGLLRGG